MPDTISNLQYALQYGGLGQILSGIKTLITILFIILFATVVYVKLRLIDLKRADEEKYKNHFIKPEDLPKLTPEQERWNKIEKLFASPSESDWRIAIIEADTMLDEFIFTLGYPGSNLGERMKNINKQYFPALDIAWDAHKIRNRIAHEGMEFHLSERDKEIARKNFEYVFRDAKLI